MEPKKAATKKQRQRVLEINDDMKIGTIASMIRKTFGDAAADGIGEALLRRSKPATAARPSARRETQ